MAKDRVALTKQVKEANDIVAVIGAYVPLRPAGKSFKGICPFHNDHHPSFQVDSTFQNYRCWSCNKTGDVFTFIQEYEKVSFLEARTILANRAGIKLDGDDGPNVARLRLLNVIKWAAEQYQECLLDMPVAEAARQYLGERKLLGEIVRKFGLGFAPLANNFIMTRAMSANVDLRDLEAVGILGISQHDGGYYERFRDRIMFPVRDARSQIVGFGGRIMPKSPLAERAPKYYNSAETPLFNKSELIYGLDLARQAGANVGYLAVVEGYTDVMMAHQSGISQVVATMGTALNARHVQQLRRFVPKIVLVFDADEGGNTGVDRALEIFASHNVDLKIATLPEGLDPCDLLTTQGPEPFQRALEKAVDALDYKMTQMLAQEANNGIDGQMRVIDAVLTVIAMAPDAPDQAMQIKREMIVTRLASRLRVREETLWLRLKELRTDRRDADEPRPQPVAAKKPVGGTAPPHERELLELLLSSPAIVPAAMKVIPPSEIAHDNVRMVVQELYNLQNEGQVPDLDALRLTITEPRLIAGMMELAYKGQQSTDDREAWLRKIVAVFEHLRNSGLKHELKSQLTNAPNIETELEILRRLQDQSGGSAKKRKPNPGGPIRPDNPDELV